MRSASMFVAATLCGIAAATSVATAAGAESAQRRNASYKVGTREAKCDNVRLLFDRRLPTL